MRKSETFRLSWVKKLPFWEPGIQVLTRAPLGGQFEHPHEFFVNNLKTAARSASVFATPYHTSFSHRLWKFQTQVTQGQVTRSRQVTLPQTVWMLVKATPNELLPWNFQRLIQVTMFIKCVSQKFDIDDLRSGQFSDLSIISQWEKNERRLFWTKTI